MKEWILSAFGTEAAPPNAPSMLHLRENAKQKPARAKRSQIRQRKFAAFGIDSMGGVNMNPVISALETSEVESHGSEAADAAAVTKQGKHNRLISTPAMFSWHDALVVYWEIPSSSDLRQVEEKRNFTGDVYGVVVRVFECSFSMQYATITLRPMSNNSITYVLMHACAHVRLRLIAQMCMMLSLAISGTLEMEAPIVLRICLPTRGKATADQRTD
eukprot:GHVU01156462.1.p1 GENE.GHVU01156462.1~~GHVU01156462.1.p1  ORF type:complete len:216 (+),score=22.57 GHVU01156462.1:817-1464(+)